MRPFDELELKALDGRPLDDCVIIDAHGHIGQCFFFPLYDSSTESIIALMDRIGIDVWCPSPYAGLCNYASRGNNIVIEAMKNFPGRIFGYMTADIGYPDTIIPELERCLDAGIRAIKIHDQIGGEIPYQYDHPNFKPLMEFADSNKLPLLAHTWGQEMKPLEKLYTRYPSIKFILAHSGAADRDIYARAAKEHENVFLETCFSLCPNGLIEYFVNEGLTDKILWGTDMNFYASEQQIGRVIFADISIESKRAILGANALRTLNITLPLTYKRLQSK